uniref:Uncharacterized protein n=1 Tax=Marseillevirus LCMAC102 TaxID=2506603 RepID=A0A481YV67_9VIRU|nr:MAG: hypothetical protein LCMAC102_01910 [Marseillevirus LCMAC102]
MKTYLCELAVSERARISRYLGGEWDRLSAAMNIEPNSIKSSTPFGCSANDYASELITRLSSRKESIESIVSACNNIGLNAVGSLIQELAGGKSSQISGPMLPIHPPNHPPNHLYKFLYETDSTEYGHSINLHCMDLKERFDSPDKRSELIGQAIRMQWMSYNDPSTRAVTGNDFLQNLPMNVPQFIQLLQDIKIFDISASLAKLIQDKETKENTLNAAIGSSNQLFHSFVQEALKNDKEAVQITLDYLNKQGYRTFDSLEELNTEDGSSLAVTGLPLRYAKLFIGAVKRNWPSP